MQILSITEIEDLSKIFKIKGMIISLGYTNSLVLKNLLEF
jgi:hypothetical protein